MYIYIYHIISYYIISPFSKLLHWRMDWTVLPPDNGWHLATSTLPSLPPGQGGFP